MDKYLGKRLDGRYEIHELIGIGGMANVYRCTDTVDDREVAIKILKDEFLNNEEFIRRFKNESKAIAMLSHPNIVKVYDVSFGDMIQYIVMEYIDGITLKEYIERQGIIEWKDVLHLVTQVLRALQHAHESGIVHRDIKPQNIMLLQDGTIKVTDFGIARFSDKATRTMTDQAIGSVHYIAPEQARGDITDGKTDIYSVGVMLYEMLTGKLPFEGDSAVTVALMQLQSTPKMPREVNPSIPVGLEQITMRAMAKKPEQRYTSAAEMLSDIERFRLNPSIVFEYANPFEDDQPTRYVNTKKKADAEKKKAQKAALKAQKAQKSVKAVKAAKPDKAVKAVVANKAVNAAKQENPANEADPAKPANDAKPAKPAKPANDAKQGKPVKTAKPKKAVKAANPQKAKKAQKPAKAQKAPKPEKEKKPKKPRRDDEEGYKEQSSVLHAIKGVIIAAVAVGLVFFVIFLIKGINSAQVKDVNVPNYVGRSLAEAKSNNPDDFQFELKNRFDQTQALGTVLAQEPAVGMTVKAGSTVILTVNSNGDEIAIPFFNSSTTNQEAAESKLRELSLIPEVVLVEGAQADKDTVIGTFPTAGAKAPIGSTVYVYVSKGDRAKTISIPPVLRMSLYEAQQELDNLGLTVETIYDDDSGEKKDTVIGTSPLPYGKVEKGTVVTLTVSSGVGDKSKKKIHFDLPTGIDKDIEMTVLIDGVENSELSKTVNPYVEPKVTLELEGSGKKEVEVRLDGQPYREFTIDMSTGEITDTQIYEYVVPTEEPTEYIEPTDYYDDTPTDYYDPDADPDNYYDDNQYYQNPYEP